MHIIMAGMFVELQWLKEKGQNNPLRITAQKTKDLR
jgi:hypothetical protein